jgi:hypothetical protein
MRWLLLILLGAFAGKAAAAPARLAILVEGSAAAIPAEMLTAELSHRADLDLIERAQIDKIHQEQARAAGSGDILKLGQILGADGLLVLTPVTAPTNGAPPGMPFLGLQSSSRAPAPVLLDARLIAVKPGVILGDTRTTWLASQPQEWIKGVVHRFEPDFPKLATLAKDAIPLSILNLRSASQSYSGEEEERQVKLLLIQKLSREPRFFVLERQQMRRLYEEKEMEPGASSAFWSGTFVLDGTLDQNGHAPDTITINARLTPPHHSSPIRLEARGSRTNLVEAVDRLAAVVRDAVGLRSAPLEWDTAAEAREYLSEARWALKWDLLPEAQQASDAAWALGEHSLECAKVRVLSWMVPDYRVVKFGSLTMRNVNPALTNLFQHPPGAPIAENARRALDIYRAYTDFAPRDQLTLNSPWYGLGVSNVASAARVLQNFYLVPSARKAAEEQLADLRAAVREVADTISKWPSVHVFYETNTPALRFEYPERRPDFSLFDVLVRQGCFIQDRPEDTLAMYRTLMRAPLFPSIHAGLWFRDYNSPRLVGWTDADERRAGLLWREFVKELGASDEVFPRLEARALAAADAWSGRRDFDVENRILRQQGRAALDQARRDEDAAIETNTIAVFEFFIANFDAIVASREPALYYNWEWNQLFARDGVGTPATEKMRRAGTTNYMPRISALLAAYAARVKALAAEDQTRQEDESWRAVFEEQKRYLSQYTPYDFYKFEKLFRVQKYTGGQAAELLPLIASYRSNLVAAASAAGKSKAQSDANWLDIFVEHKLRRLIDGPPRVPAVVTGGAPSLPALAPTPLPSPSGPRPVAPPGQDLAVSADTLVLRDYSVFPRALFNDTNVTTLAIGGVQWCNGKLVVGMSFQGSFEGRFSVGQGAAAIFDSQSGKWDLIRFPVGQADDFGGNGFSPAAFFGPRAARRESNVHLFHDALYLSAGTRIKRFDLKTRQWTVTELPQHADAHFFTIGGRLFAASSELIFEVKDDGRESVIMASTRRRPAASVLDSLDDLGKSVVLAEGPEGTVRAWVKENIYGWRDGNWREEFALPGIPELAGQALLCRAEFSPSPRVCLLAPSNSAPEVLWEGKRNLRGVIVSPSRRQAASAPVKPAWSSWDSARYAHGQGTVFNANVYILGDDLRAQDQPKVWLVSLLREQSAPVAVPLVFGNGTGAAERQRRHLGSGTQFLWLAPHDRALVIVDGRGMKLWSVPFEEVDRAAKGQSEGIRPAASGGGTAR